MAYSGTAPSTVAPCKHCGRETVWLRLVYGGWHLFDVDMFPIDDSFRGNRFAIQRRTRQVVDLDCVLESRWPKTCMRLHRYQCPESFDAARHHHRRPRQPNDIDLVGMFTRLADRKSNDEDETITWTG